MRNIVREQIKNDLVSHPHGLLIKLEYSLKKQNWYIRFMY